MTANPETLAAKSATPWEEPAAAGVPGPTVRRGGMRRDVPIVRRRMASATLLLIILFLIACQHTPSSRLESDVVPEPPVEIDGFLQARQRSQALRTQLEVLPRGVREQFLRDAHPSEDLLTHLRVLKREYFAVRESLFETAFLHASAIVERPEERTLPSVLVRTSLALMAGVELLRNLHAVAAVLSNSSACRLAWEEADPEAGIPAQSWELSLQAYRNTGYQDLFRGGIQRLTLHRSLLEAYAKSGDGRVRALYPAGVDAALEAAEQVSSLMLARLAGEDLGQDEREVRGLVETSRLLRADWVATGSVLQEAIARDGGLIRGPVHTKIQEAKREYLDQREALYRIAFKHVSKLTRHEIPYPRAFRLRAVGISLLAGVMLYENARIVQVHILTMPGVRSLLNQGDPSLGVPPGFWDNIEREFVRIEYRDLLEAGIRVIEGEQRCQNLSGVGEDPFLTFVSRELSASEAMSEIRGESPELRMGRTLRYLLERLYLRGRDTLAQGEAVVSMGVGNLLGAFELRKGKLFGQRPWVDFVQERLQPGDLLVEKTPFRLTDKFIPGHFGHVAMYVGTEDQLRALGLLDHPWVSRYRSQIARGHTIVEALRSGTQLNSIERFLNVDDLAILRPKPEKLSSADVAQAVALAFSHVGKRYDFNFDANTWDTIVCSELAFHTYIHVRWPVHRIITSYTISPDDVAVLAGSDGGWPFRLVAFIHDGQLVHDQASALDGEALYNRLLRGRYAPVAP